MCTLKISITTLKITITTAKISIVPEEIAQRVEAGLARVEGHADRLGVDRAHPPGRPVRLLRVERSRWPMWQSDAVAARTPAQATPLLQGVPFQRVW